MIIINVIQPGLSLQHKMLLSMRALKKKEIYIYIYRNQPKLQYLKIHYIHSSFVDLHINLLLITSNARYRQPVNTIMLMNTLAILRVTFGNFRTLSLTTSFCVNLHINQLTTDYFERALLPACEHYHVNEQPRNTLRVISVTFHHYH